MFILKRRALALFLSSKVLNKSEVIDELLGLFLHQNVSKYEDKT